MKIKHKLELEQDYDFYVFAINSHLKAYKFCWLINLKLALVYSTEKSTFVLLMPFLIYKSLFSKRIIFFDHINISKVNWKNSLSFTRYKVELHKLFWNN